MIDEDGLPGHKHELSLKQANGQVEIPTMR